ncbi:MAG: benzoyl-CoA-dihydrodiol lyase [Alphaproteobacteria bacterium]|nr:benzoyl-CoA-dihydrodiol lyase [Alphaproteobacteria bacterium]
MASQPKVTHVESFQTHPSAYKHWKLSFDGPIATLALDIQEGNGLRPDDYELKQNSYDLGVDIELADAVERIRFEHPEVKTVVLTSAQDRIFCAGANIKMLATSTHGFKVNFCRYTNETRCGIEDASENSGIRFLAACNGTAAGGGYELALAADRILLVDDGSSVVSLPEVPLLGVLPGTGGLTRMVDKRGIRRDISDVFCTKAEGFRSRDAVKYRIIDGSFPRSKWDEGVKKVADEMAATASDRSGPGMVLPEVTRPYRWVEVAHDDDGRVATITIQAPTSAPPTTGQALRAEGAATWSVAAMRELDDALLHLRFMHDTIGLILLKTTGDAAQVIAHEEALDALAGSGDWLAREIQLFQARVLRRVDNTAKSMFAIIEPGSCFAGILFELTLAADRSYMLEDEDGEVTVQVTAASAGRFPMSTGITRLGARFVGTPEAIQAALDTDGPIDAPEAFDLGLVTLAPDDIDWEDEIRIAIEERVSLSPDALTGMEQNLRFVGSENCDSKIFGRLSAWQNWIFQRPNAVGDEGALTLYGHPTRPRFDWRRT